MEIEHVLFSGDTAGRINAISLTNQLRRMGHMLRTSRVVNEKFRWKRFARFAVLRFFFISFPVLFYKKRQIEVRAGCSKFFLKSLGYKQCNC